jgi:hypothetical protein
VLVAALKEIWIWAMYIKALNNGWDKIATDMLVQAYSEKDKNTHLQKVLHDSALVLYTIQAFPPIGTSLSKVM